MLAFSDLLLNLRLKYLLPLVTKTNLVHEDFDYLEYLIHINHVLIFFV